jgi:ABC-2 type transport system permease protein
MLGALLYLRLTSLKNLLLSRVRRLRQPKYLVGAIVGGAYFYFVIFNGFGSGKRRAATPAIMSPDQFVPPPESGELMLALGALALLTVIVFMWVLPSKSPGLSFSEAETAFLFPAPISRRALIHFKLLSNQLSVLLQSVFFSLIFNSRGLSSGRALQIVVGWWLILTLVSLHYTGVSLALARLFERGVSVLRRRLMFLGAMGIAVAITLFWIRRDVRAPSASDFADVESGARWLMAMLDTGLLHWLLLPFKWILSPFFASGMREFALALGPAAALLLVHYYWVLKMEVSFEEASLAQAEKRAIRRAGLRSGDYRFGQNAPKARRAPFALADTGRPEVAFLWKNLLSTHSFFNLRVWLICAGVIIVGTQWISGIGPAYENIIAAVGGGALVVGLYVLMFGPLLARFDLRRDLAHADVLKTYPIPGWQLVLGELLAPMVIITGVIWLTLLTGVCAIQPTRVLPAWLDPSLRATCAGCVAMVTPIVVALQLLVPNAAAIVFPAWFQATRTVGGGIDLMGQRLIFVFGQAVIIVLALIPAAATAALLIFTTQWIFGAVLAVIFATVVVVAVLIAEVWCALWWLGGRFERFDLSLEQRP